MHCPHPLPRQSVCLRDLGIWIVESRVHEPRLAPAIPRQVIRSLEKPPALRSAREIQKSTFEMAAASPSIPIVASDIPQVSLK